MEEETKITFKERTTSGSIPRQFDDDSIMLCQNWPINVKVRCVVRDTGFVRSLCMNM